MEIGMIVYSHKSAWLRDLQVDQSGNTVKVIRHHKYGIDVAQRIKVTLGITGWSRPRVHIDDAVWHLDVGSSHPGAGEGPKGMAVRHLKRYASWVQNVVRQFGPYLLWTRRILRKFASSTRGPKWTNLWCIGCQAYWHGRVAKFGRDNHWKHLSGKPIPRLESSIARL
jgi:hypothetical protein